MNKNDTHTAFDGSSRNEAVDIAALAAMLQSGDVPEEYDSIIRNISDDDLERLWATFRESRCGVRDQSR